MKRRLCVLGPHLEIAVRDAQHPKSRECVAGPTGEAVLDEPLPAVDLDELTAVVTPEGGLVDVGLGGAAGTFADQSQRNRGPVPFDVLVAVLDRNPQPVSGAGWAPATVVPGGCYEAARGHALTFL